MQYYLLFESLAQANDVLPIGKTTLIRAGKLAICLVHTEDGFFAVSDYCTHQKANLHKGQILPQNRIKCPWHGYSFHLKSGSESSDNHCKDLETYSLKIDETGFWILI